MMRVFARTARANEHASRTLSLFASRSPWPLAALLALLAACIADFVAIPPWPRGPVLALLGAMVVFFGLLHGALWALAFSLIGRLPRPLRLAIWPVAGAASGVWVGWLLGTFPRLQSRYWQLAAGVLAACVGAGIVLGLVVTLFQPRGNQPAWLSARRRWLQVATALALLGLAAGAWYVDRRYYPGQYFYGHLALRLVVVWSTMLALVAAGGGRLALGVWAWVFGLASFAACVFTPNAQRLLPALAARPYPGQLLKISQRMTDFDRDGYSAFLGGGDCAPWNPKVNPGQREIPDNGIDDNCLLGDATRKVDDLAEVPLPATPAPIDVVLITVDSLRPDHLGIYNEAFGPNGRKTSPHLDRFAKSATIFDSAYTTGAWTSVAVPSLLRGVYPRRLQWKRWFETTMYALVRKPFEGKLRPGEQMMRMFPLAFDDRHPPIASMLRRRGMYTAAITDDGHSEMLQPSTGLQEGFVSFREVDNAPDGRHNDAGTTDMAISTLNRVPASKRFFMWVHYFGIHWPDDTHVGVPTYGPTQADAYDHEVAFFDQECGRLLAAIDARPNPVAVIIAADHGESLVAGIRQHGLTLEEAVIKIPLIVRAPGWPAKHVKSPVSTLDLVPTILGLTGTPAPKYLDGIDIRSVVDAPADKPRILFSDTWRYDARERMEINYSAAFDGTNKVVVDRMTGGIYEFDQRNEVHPLERSSTDPAFRLLTRALFGYLEETGGALDLSE